MPEGGYHQAEHLQDRREGGGQRTAGAAPGRGISVVDYSASKRQSKWCTSAGDTLEYLYRQLLIVQQPAEHLQSALFVATATAAVPYAR